MAGVIAKGSVNQALKGKYYYKTGLHCLRLMYETFMHQLVKKRLTPSWADEMRENLAILRDANLPRIPHCCSYSSGTCSPLWRPVTSSCP